MTEFPIKVGLVYGSTRPGRFCDTIAKWTATQVCAREGFALENIDPAATESNLDPSTLKKRIAACDAFIVITPEYNHGYPAPLKALIDSFGPEWHAKPVAFVSYGGVSGAWEQFDANGILRNPERAERSMDAMLRRLQWWAVSLAHARNIWPYAKTA